MTGQSLSAASFSNREHGRPGIDPNGGGVPDGKAVVVSLAAALNTITMERFPRSCCGRQQWLVVVWGRRGGGTCECRAPSFILLMLVKVAARANSMIP